MTLAPSAETCRPQRPVFKSKCARLVMRPKPHCGATLKSRTTEFHASMRKRPTPLSDQTPLEKLFSVLPRRSNRLTVRACTRQVAITIVIVTVGASSPSGCRGGCSPLRIIVATGRPQFLADLLRCGIGRGTDVAVETKLRIRKPISSDRRCARGQQEWKCH